MMVGDFAHGYYMNGVLVSLLKPFLAGILAHW